MIEIREGSLISKLLYILTVTGEFPVCSISLLGNYQSYLRLIQKATKPCEYINSKTKARYKVKALAVVGKGKQKRIHFLSGVHILLEWLGLWTLFQKMNGGFHYRGGKEYEDRVCRVAEGYAIAYRCGLEINPMQIPKLQNKTIKKNLSQEKCYYGGKELKGVSIIEMSKNAYTRIVGAVFANRNVYAVYNTRMQTMKWSGKGEQKALINLEEISRMNANVTRVHSAILLGKHMDIARRTLENVKRTPRLEFCFDGIYAHIHFIPLDDNGIRQFRMLLVEDWREEMLSALFPEEMRSYDQGGFEYDASVGEKYIFTFFDGDIARLERFRYAAQRIKGEYEVLCFPFQVELIKDYLGDLVTIKTINLEVMENAIGIGGES